MDEEDDDIYAQAGNRSDGRDLMSQAGSASSMTVQPIEESGEEVEEDESDSDIDIIIEKRDEPRKSTVQDPNVIPQKKQIEVKSPLNHSSLPQKEPSIVIKNESVDKEASMRPGASYPAVQTSTIDVNAQPVHEPTGKPIIEVDMDADFAEDEKTWRRPGSDMTDYFNYGFDEFTWANYCLKQQNLRKENTDAKKQMDEMQNFLSSGMPGLPGGPNGGMAPTPNLNDIPPEMQHMFGQMMSQGIDPSQMDPGTFMQMMSGGQGGQGSGSQNYGQQHNQQQMGYGYGGGNQGRGRGRRW